MVRRQKTQIALRSLRLVTLMKMFAEKHMGETPRTNAKSRKDLAESVADKEGSMPVSQIPLLPPRHQPVSPRPTLPSTGEQAQPAR